MKKLYYNNWFNAISFVCFKQKSVWNFILIFNAMQIKQSHTKHLENIRKSQQKFNTKINIIKSAKLQQSDKNILNNENLQILKSSYQHQHSTTAHRCKSPLTAHPHSIHACAHNEKLHKCRKQSIWKKLATLGKTAQIPTHTLHATQLAMHPPSTYQRLPHHYKHNIWQRHVNKHTGGKQISLHTFHHNSCKPKKK